MVCLWNHMWHTIDHSTMVTIITDIIVIMCCFFQHIQFHYSCSSYHWWSCGAYTNKWDIHVQWYRIIMFATSQSAYCTVIYADGWCDINTIRWFVMTGCDIKTIRWFAMTRCDIKTIRWFVTTIRWWKAMRGKQNTMFSDLSCFW